jgi:hypothetical protein
MSDLYRVTLSYACYGVVVRDGQIIEAAPIARWSVGKPLAQFAAWVRKKGGKLEVVP